MLSLLCRIREKTDIEIDATFLTSVHRQWSID